MTRVRRREYDRVQGDIDRLNTVLTDLYRVTESYTLPRETRDEAQKKADELRLIKDDLLWKLVRISQAIKVEEETGTTSLAKQAASADPEILAILELIQ